MSNDRKIINVKRRADHLLADPVPCSGCGVVNEFLDLVPGAEGGVFCLECFEFPELEKQRDAAELAAELLRSRSCEECGGRSTCGCCTCSPCAEHAAVKAELLAELAAERRADTAAHEAAHRSGWVDARICQGIGCPFGGCS